ncbi:MAG TPA: AMP-binding protein [Acidimicrobiales bacterium]|nr:AMP-binding protein [Acidimicrobiales bacterium]
MEPLRPPEADDRQRRMAGALAAAGCRPGDRVAFCLPSSADLLCAVLGAARTGVVPVLLNATLLPAERDLLLDDAEPVLSVLDPAALAALADGPPVDLAPRPLTRPMHYTSGTTGRPKGVTTGLWDDRTAAAVFDDEADLWGFDPADLHLVCSPMYHTVAIRFAAGTLLRGGSLAILDRFDPAAALDVLRRQRPTTTFMAPTHLQRLLALPHLGDQERFGSLRLLVHAGSPCPPVLKRAAMARSDHVWEFYGSTEGQFTACSPDEWLARPGTVGRARPGRRLAVTADGDGPAGTVWCHAPPFARFEYWRNPAATAAAWRGDAFTVGDLGHLDDDGYLYLSGRRDDLIITGGVNVYPAEVEAALMEVPGVDEVAVIGVPDDDWGQRVVAVVVGDADLADVRSAADQRLAPYKRPKDYRRADRLPHTATGKLIRREVG